MTELAISVYSILALEGLLNRSIFPAYAEIVGAPIRCSFEPNAAIMARVKSGERPDVIMAVSGSIPHLVSANAVEANSLGPIARVGVGLAVSRGAPSPVIDTVPALTEALLSARSVAYSARGASGMYFANLVAELGISDHVVPRATIVDSGYTAQALLDGRADLAVQQISELLYVREVDFAGPLPQQVQRYTEFSVGASPRAAARREVIEFVSMLRSDDIRPAYSEAGLEAIPSAPPGRRLHS